MVKVTLTLVVLNNKEEFLQFLDPELCHLEESIEVGGLRTLNFEYKFQDFSKDKELFRVGNKIWVQGDVNIRDCLYVINTEVKQDIYQENSFTLEMEEVLVELNNAPVFSQTELTENSNIFKLTTNNGKKEVTVDWNSLNYWFGDYFNIGVVQDCISAYASRISVTGTVNRMELLRNIEEETGNVFITRYEKDLINNTIHRYLDFLNPININKNWQINLEYDFYDTDNTVLCYDAQGNLVPEDKDWEVTRFENSKYDDESVSPDDPETDDEEDYDTEKSEDYDAESQEIYDYEQTKDYTPRLNINPEHCVFRMVNTNYQLMNTNGEPYSSGGELDPLQWSCVTAGLDATDYPHYLISLMKIGDILGVAVNEKTYAIGGIGEKQLPYLPAFKELDYGEHISIATDCEINYSKIPDDCYFEIYNTHNNQVLFRTQLNFQIGKVHEEILDFGENLENIEFNVDETETYTAISPLIQVNDNTGNGNNLSWSDVDTIINRWLNLSIEKGKVYPMIVEKFNIEANDLNSAKTILGEKTLTGNYWERPLKPADNTDSTPRQYEFYRAIAYWQAPYTKNAGEMHVSTNKTGIEYDSVHVRPDTRDELAKIGSPKIGNTETTDEDIYAIYNQVALYLKEHETPNIEVELDVANLRGHEFNNYDIHDKIYLKLPNTQELITARVTKTSKEAHDIAKNTIEIKNYRNVNTIKTLPHETFINANNAQFKYPNSQNLTVSLENAEVDDSHPQYVNGKLLTFTLYKLENGSATLTGKVYTKLTDAYGRATINMKYDPGDYEIDIQFTGDEEYLESSVTINVNVGGTLPVQLSTTNNPREDNTLSKTTNKTSTGKKTKKVKQYWTKCGLSPDKKHKQIVSIAQPSSADASKYKYQQLWKTVFKNYCPNCKNWGGLRFDGGKANKCITSSTYGVHYKPGVPEHEVTCIYCDSDYCGVTGLEKSHGHISRLKTVKKPVKSSKTEFNKLVKGKLLHSTKTVTVKTKQNVNKQNDRKVKASGINDKVKKQALAIVKNKKGYNAARAITSWIDNHIVYAGYPNFERSPATVLSKGSGNCCDVTRLLLQMLDVAGCTEYFKMEYVHVTGHVYARLTTKKTGKTRPVDCASDYSGAWGYICRNYRGLHEYKTQYPKLPF